MSTAAKGTGDVLPAGGSPRAASGAAAPMTMKEVLKNTVSTPTMNRLERKAHRKTRRKARKEFSKRAYTNPFQRSLHNALTWVEDKFAQRKKPNVYFDTFSQTLYVDDERFPPEKSFWYFLPNHDMRRRAISLVTDRWYKHVVILMIFFHSFTVLAQQPEVFRVAFDSQQAQDFLLIMDRLLLMFFVIEFLIQNLAHTGFKMLKSPFLLLDGFMILVSVSLDLVPRTSPIMPFLFAFNSLRAFRVVNRAKGMRQLMLVVVESSSTIGSVSGLILVLIIMYALGGIYLFGGATHWQCSDGTLCTPPSLTALQLPPPGQYGMPTTTIPVPTTRTTTTRPPATTTTTTTTATTTQGSILTSQPRGFTTTTVTSTAFSFSAQPTETATPAPPTTTLSPMSYLYEFQQFLNVPWNTFPCFPGDTCQQLPVAADPWANFDHLGFGALAVMRVITLDNWIDIANANMNSSGNPFGAYLYFFTLTIVGSFWAVNLVLAVIADAFSRFFAEQQLELEALMRAKQTGEAMDLHRAVGSGLIGDAGLLAAGDATGVIVPGSANAAATNNGEDAAGGKPERFGRGRRGSIGEISLPSDGGHLDLNNSLSDIRPRAYFGGVESIAARLRKQALLGSSARGTHPIVKQEWKHWLAGINRASVTSLRNGIGSVALQKIQTQLQEEEEDAKRLQELDDMIKEQDHLLHRPLSPFSFSSKRGRQLQWEQDNPKAVRKERRRLEKLRHKEEKERRLRQRAELKALNRKPSLVRPTRKSGDDDDDDDNEEDDAPPKEDESSDSSTTSSSSSEDSSTTISSSSLDSQEGVEMASLPGSPPATRRRITFPIDVPLENPTVLKQVITRQFDDSDMVMQAEALKQYEEENPQVFLGLPGYENHRHDGAEGFDDQHGGDISHGNRPYEEHERSLLADAALGSLTNPNQQIEKKLHDIATWHDDVDAQSLSTLSDHRRVEPKSLDDEALFEPLLKVPSFPSAFDGKIYRHPKFKGETLFDRYTSAAKADIMDPTFWNRPDFSAATDAEKEKILKERSGRGLYHGHRKRALLAVKTAFQAAQTTVKAISEGAQTARQLTPFELVKKIHASRIFDRIVTIIIIVNVLVLCTDTWDAPKWQKQLIDAVHGIVDIIVICNGIASIMIVGRKIYFRRLRKTLAGFVDGAVECFCLIDLLLVISNAFPILKIFRIFRLVKVLKNLNVFKELIALFRTSLYYFISLLVLLIIFILVSTLAARSLFSNVIPEITSCPAYRFESFCNSDPTNTCVYVSQSEWITSMDPAADFGSRVLTPPLLLNFTLDQMNLLIDTMIATQIPVLGSGVNATVAPNSSDVIVMGMEWNYTAFAIAWWSIVNSSNVTWNMTGMDPPPTATTSINGTTAIASITATSTTTAAMVTAASPFGNNFTSPTTTTTLAPTPTVSTQILVLTSSSLSDSWDYFTSVVLTGNYSCRQYQGWQSTAGYQRLNFNSLSSSFLTVFTILTRDNWENIMYYVMQVYPVGAIYFIAVIIIGSYIILTLLVAVLLVNFDQQPMNFAGGEGTGGHQEGDGGVHGDGAGGHGADADGGASKRNDDDGASPKGSDQGSENGEDAEVGGETEEQAQQKMDQAERQRDLREAARAAGPHSRAAEAAREAEAFIQSPESGGVTLLKEEPPESIELDEARPFFSRWFRYGLRLLCDIPDPIVRVSKLEGVSLFFFRPTNSIRLFCAKVLSGTYFPFERIVFVIVMLDCIVGFCGGTFLPLHDPRILVFDVVLSLIQVAELFLRLIVQGGMMGPHSYIKHSVLNQVDFIAITCTALSMMFGLVASAGGPTLVHSGVEGYTVSFQMTGIASTASNPTIYAIALGLKAMKPTRVMMHSRAMRNVVKAVALSAPDVLRFLVVAGVLFLTAAVICVQVFSGRMRTCSDGSDRSISECIGVFKSSLPTDVVFAPTLQGPTVLDSSGNLILSATAMNGTVGYSNRTWRNMAPYHFDDTFTSFVTLFQVALGTEWTNVLFGASDAPANPGESPFRQLRITVVLMFMLWVFLGNFVVMNIFVGVVVDRFTKLKLQMSGSLFLTEEQSDIAHIRKLLHQTQAKKVLNLGATPFISKKLNEWCFWVISKPFFQVCMRTTLFLSVIVMATIHYRQTAVWDQLQAYATFVFATMMTIELILKIGVAGPRAYFVLAYHKLELMITVQSWIDLILEAVEVEVPFWRFLRLLRILRLVREQRGFRRLLHTGYRSLPAMWNVGSLLILVFYMFAAVGMAMFSSVRNVTKSTSSFVFDRLVNFQSFPKAMINLYTIATLDVWGNPVMGGNVAYPFCTPGENCGNTIGTRLYFLVFTLCVGLVMINLFITVVLENFSESVLLPTYMKEKMQDVNLFRKEWVTFDPAGRQIIHASQFVPLLRSLPGPRRRLAQLQGLIHIQGVEETNSQCSWTPEEMEYYAAHCAVGLGGESTAATIPTLKQLSVPITTNQEILFADAIDAIGEKIFHVTLVDSKVSTLHRRAKEAAVEYFGQFQVKHYVCAVTIQQAWRDYWKCKKYYAGGGSVHAKDAPRRTYGNKWNSVLMPILRQVWADSASGVFGEESAEESAMLRKLTRGRKRKEGAGGAHGGENGPDDKDDPQQENTSNNLANQSFTSNPISVQNATPQHITTSGKHIKQKLSIAEALKTKMIEVDDIVEDTSWKHVIEDTQSWGGSDGEGEDDDDRPGEEYWMTAADRKRRREYLRERALRDRRAREESPQDQNGAAAPPPAPAPMEPPPRVERIVTLSEILLRHRRTAACGLTTPVNEKGRALIASLPDPLRPRWHALPIPPAHEMDDPPQVSSTMMAQKKLQFMSTAQTSKKGPKLQLRSTSLVALVQANQAKAKEMEELADAPAVGKSTMYEDEQDCDVMPTLKGLLAQRDREVKAAERAGELSLNPTSLSFGSTVEEASKKPARMSARPSARSVVGRRNATAAAAAARASSPASPTTRRGNPDL